MSGRARISARRLNPRGCSSSARGHGRDAQDENHSPTTADVQRASEIFESRKLARRGLRIGRTSVGKGVFATRRIIDGTCIGEIAGEIIIDDDYESRYAFDLEDGRQLEPAAPFRFVNHSCEPNCAFDLIGIQLANHLEARSGVRRKLLLFAIADIACGEELTIDYNWPASFAIRCHCRTPTCRGWIVKRQHLDRLLLT